MLTSVVLVFFNLFPTIWVCDPSLLTGCGPKILLVFKKTSETPCTIRQMQTRESDISWALDVFNKQNRNFFQLIVFCRCFLLCFVKESKPSVVFQEKETLTPDFSAGREISMVTSGTLSDFQDDMAGPEYSGDMPQPSWNSVVNLRVNLRPCLCAPFPSTFRCGWRHVTPDLLLLKTFHCGRSSVRHLAVNFSKSVKSLILSGKVKEPPNVS